MDKKSAQASSSEAKLQALGAAPAEKKDPLADAKKAFEGALAKTKAQAEKDGIEDAAVIEDPKRTARREAKRSEEQEKPAPKAEEKSEFLALKAELAELRDQLKPKEQHKAETKQDDFESVKKELAEHFGDEEGEILTGALKHLLAPREQRIAHLESMIQKAVEQSKALSAKTNRVRLAKEFRSLEDDAAWEIVQERAQTLIGLGKHQTADEAYEAVATALYGKPTKQRIEEDAEEIASRIAASTPTQPNSVRRERKLSPNDKSRAIFDHLFKNPEDAAGAKRLARELRVDN